MRVFPECFRGQFKDVEINALLCNTCRIRVMKDEVLEDGNSSSESTSSNSEEFSQMQCTKYNLNISLNALGEGEINSKE